ncbi:MAG: ChaN family lipoprotein [Phycisphaerales bacterium JB052]
MTIRTACRLLTCCALTTLLTGCTTQTREDEQAMRASMRDSARSVVILNGDGSGTTTWSQAIAEMASADVVLMGEVHNHPLGNAVQQEMYEDILTANPNALLSMEFYERDEQVALDDYLAGITDREAFEKAADRNPGNNPWAHARMIDASKEANRPVIASNAPRRYVKLARSEGFERLHQLNEHQRALVEIPTQTPQGAYRDRFIEAMGGMASHGGEEMIEGFLRSQATWDATMAQSIVDAMSQGTPVVHVVGYFHAQFPFEAGSSELVDQLRARAGRAIKIVTCITLPSTHDEIQDHDRNIADFVVYVGSPDAHD